MKTVSVKIIKLFENDRPRSIGTIDASVDFFTSSKSLHGKTVEFVEHQANAVYRCLDGVVFFIVAHIDGRKTVYIAPIMEKRAKKVPWLHRALSSVPRLEMSMHEVINTASETMQLENLVPGKPVQAQP